MNDLSEYHITNVEQIPSPALVFFKSMIVHNIETALRWVGSPQRLRPHIKTHKTAEIVALQRAAGITNFKCATLAEAEMLAHAEVPDILLAYPMIGPNIRLLLDLVERYPKSTISTLVDSVEGIHELTQTAARAAGSRDVFLDVNVGQHRTGVMPEQLHDFFELVSKQKILRLRGLHIYDGHLRASDLAERTRAVEQFFQTIEEQLPSLSRISGQPIELVCGGTPSFAVWASKKIPTVQCSPGTFILHDCGYGQKFPELAEFRLAAALLTRVISLPGTRYVTLDAGTKSLCADVEFGKRLTLAQFPEHRVVSHNEEHYLVETMHDHALKPGQTFLAWPTHICTTVAQHDQAYIIEQNQQTESWKIAARGRVYPLSFAS